MNKCLECNVETSNPKFCTLSCSAKMQARSRVLKDRTKCCLKCGNSFQYNSTPKQKFCNSSCSASFSNTNRSKRTENKFCIQCESAPTNNKHAKFCSSKCSSIYRSEKIINDWIVNPDTATTKQGIKLTIKKYLIRNAEYKCSICGWGEINESIGRSPLEIDHIDGNAYNNNQDNLRVVCPNCHSLTPTYRALNKKSARSYRKN